MPERNKGTTAAEDGDDDLTPGRILVAFEKLFGGGRGVQKFARSGLRHVKLAGGASLVEQNPAKKSEWAELERQGRSVALVMSDGDYLARVVVG